MVPGAQNSPDAILRLCPELFFQSNYYIHILPLCLYKHYEQFGLLDKTSAQKPRDCKFQSSLRHERWLVTLGQSHSLNSYSQVVVMGKGKGGRSVGYVHHLKLYKNNEGRIKIKQMQWNNLIPGPWCSDSQNDESAEAMNHNKIRKYIQLF